MVVLTCEMVENDTKIVDKFFRVTCDNTRKMNDSITIYDGNGDLKGPGGDDLSTLCLPLLVAHGLARSRTKRAVPIAAGAIWLTSLLGSAISYSLTRDVQVDRPAPLPSRGCDKGLVRVRGFRDFP